MTNAPAPPSELRSFGESLLVYLAVVLVCLGAGVVLGCLKAELTTHFYDTSPHGTGLPPPDYWKAAVRIGPVGALFGLVLGGPAILLQLRRPRGPIVLEGLRGLFMALPPTALAVLLGVTGVLTEVVSGLPFGGQTPLAVPLTLLGAFVLLFLWWRLSPQTDSAI